MENHMVISSFAEHNRLYGVTKIGLNNSKFSGNNDQYNHRRGVGRWPRRSAWSALGTWSVPSARACSRPRGSWLSTWRRTSASANCAANGSCTLATWWTTCACTRAKSRTRAWCVADRSHRWATCARTSEASTPATHRTRAKFAAGSSRRWAT